MKLENIFILLAIAILFCMTLTVIHYCPKMRSERKYEPDTVVFYDTIIQCKTETIKTINSKVVRDTILRYDTIKSDTVLTFGQKTYLDTLCNEKDSLILKSFISGISAQKDSLQAIWKKQEKIVTNTVVVTNTVEAKRKLIEFHPQGTFGYDPFNKRFGFVVGFGGSVNF